MITGFFYQSSGLGNQLHRYVATRVLAENKGYEWGMRYVPNDPSKAEGFKGGSFMRGDFWGKGVDPARTFSFFQEKKIVENGIDIRSYDPEFNFVCDDTIIDGEFQDIRYFEHKLGDIDKWLDVEELDIPQEDWCVIGFRGGEYYAYKELGLPQEYFEMAISEMRKINPFMKFEIHTDDVELAKRFFPDTYPIHHIELNWRSMRFAKYAIISNSSFYILPRLLKHYNVPGAVTIAPRFWARYNTGIWALPQNYYPQFHYIHHEK